MTLAGGCFCGQVRYQTEDEPTDCSICHCIDCRRASGAASMGFFTVQRSMVRWTGEGKLFRSSDIAHRRFCPNCGTSLSWEGERSPDEIDIALATLDDPNQVRPEAHIWVSQSPVWDKIGDDLPTHARSRVPTA